MRIPQTKSKIGRETNEIVYLKLKMNSIAYAVYRSNTYTTSDGLNWTEKTRKNKMRESKLFSAQEKHKNQIKHITWIVASPYARTSRSPRARAHLFENPKSFVISSFIGPTKRIKRRSGDKRIRETRFTGAPHVVRWLANTNFRWNMKNNFTIRINCRCESYPGATSPRS